MTEKNTPRPARNLATTEEVADYLRVKPRALIDWRSRGVGPAFVRVGRYARYRWEDVEAYLREQERRGYDTGLTYGR